MRYKRIASGSDRTLIDCAATPHRDILEIAVAGCELYKCCRAGVVRII